MRRTPDYSRRKGGKYGEKKKNILYVMTFHSTDYPWYKVNKEESLFYFDLILILKMKNNSMIECSIKAVLTRHT